MQQLINMMYPSHSPQRSELREQWNKTDNVAWEDYLYQAALEKSNELIAKFLGHSPDPSSGVWGIDCPHEGYGWHTETMKYHWSCDWLMPVVDNIEGLGYRFEMTSSPDAGGRPPIPRGYGFVAFTLPKGQISSAWKPEITEEQATIGNWATTRINATYLAVVRFIIWYNEKTQ